MTDEIVESKPQEELVEEAPKEEVKDRTSEQFEKLTQSNKELKQKNDQLQNVLESLTPNEVPPSVEQRYEAPINKAPSANQYANLEQQDIDAAFKSMMDKDGYLDGNKLLAMLKNMDQRATGAEQRAKRAEEHAIRVQSAQEGARKTEIMRKVHAKFPALDPESEEFNQDFYDVVRNELIDQMMKGKENPMEAAEKWHQKLYVNNDMKKSEKAQKQETDNQKAQINATRPKSSAMVGYYKEAKDKELQDKIRRGVRGALAEKLRRIGQ